MAELDTSLHTLNNSSSKQKYSFSKNDRFRYTKPTLFSPHAEAMSCIKSPPPGPAGSLPSAMAKRTWAWGLINLYPPLAPTSWGRSLRRISILGLTSAVGGLYIYWYLGNGDERALQRQQNIELHTRTREVRRQQVHPWTQIIKYETKVARCFDSSLAEGSHSTRQNPGPGTYGSQ